MDLTSELNQMKAWNDNIAHILGDGAVKGSRAHFGYDHETDHLLDVWKSISSLINNIDDKNQILKNIKVFNDLIIMCFNEIKEDVDSNNFSNNNLEKISA